MNPDLIPWRAKKLADDSFAYLVPDAEIRADGGKMCVKVIVSTETMDRERDILIAKGCDTRDHKANPIVLLNHRKDWPGIAQSQDPDGRYTVKALDDRIEAVNWFNQSSKLALQSFRLVESGALRGVSPGFLTVPNQTRKFKAADGHPAFIYDQWKLVEITHCPIGMNPEALVLAVEKGFSGEALLPELKELLVPFVPERKAQETSGWDAKSAATLEIDADEEIDLSDAEAVPVTPSTAYYHAMWQKAFDFLGMANELSGIQEVERTKADGRVILGHLGRILDICQKGHAGHVADYPEQPGLPDSGVNDDITPGRMSEWRVKAMAAWEDFKRERAAAAESCPDIKDAVAFLRTVANDKLLRTHIRAVAKQFAAKLSNVKMVKVPPDDDDEAEWGKVVEGANRLAERFASLEKV